MSQSEDVKIREELPKPWELTKYVDNEVEEQEAPKNFGGPLPSFKWLCESLFDKLDKAFQKSNYYTNGRQSVTEQKERIIEQFFKEWRGTVGPNIYPALCLILPHKDRSRIYNIKDYTLGRRILELLKIPKNSETTETILKWKRSKSAKDARMSEICIDVIRSRRTDNKGGIVSITEVNQILDKLARFDCKKDQQDEILSYLLENMSFLELQYFFDILLKKNVVRNMENRLLNAWHPDAQQYLSAVTSLKTVAYRLYDPSKRLGQHDLSVNLAKPFAPQLALKPRLTYARVVEKLKNEFFIEEKMDGERIQMHFEDYGNVIHYWSRKATDYTYLYGETLTKGCISPHLKFVKSVKNCVLDGEMITYDPQRNAILPFGVLKGSAVAELQRLDEGSETTLSARPLFVVFDLLYLNDRSLINQPLERRKSFLNQILKPSPKFVEIIEATKADNEDAIKRALSQVVERGSEGVVLKQTHSIYEIDKRNDNWVKIKPEYLEEFGENVDLVVIGRESSKKDMYYCGLRITDEDTEDQKKPKFWSFCRVANGFDADEYREIDRITKGKWKTYSKEKPPSSLLEFGKREPQEWIDPRESFVIEVKARSIDRSISKNYKTSTTLYNAYNRKIRDDKSWENAATLEDYKAIKESRTSVNTAEQKIATKKKRLIRKRKRESQDEEIWNNEDFIAISRNSDIFSDLTFMILSDAFYKNSRVSTEELTALVHKNGGKISKNETKIQDLQNLRVISDKNTNQAVALYSKGFDIIKSSWLFKCIELDDVLKMEPRYCFNVSESLKEKAQSRVDDLGDSYCVPVNEDELKKLFDNGSDQIDDDFPIDENLYEVSLFGTLKVFVKDIKLSKDQYLYHQVVLKLKLFGAQVTDIEHCNLIVIPEYSEHELVSKCVKEIRKKLGSKIEFTEDSATTIRIVTEKWVDASIKERTQVDARDYPVITNRD